MKLALKVNLSFIYLNLNISVAILYCWKIRKLENSTSTLVIRNVEEWQENA